VSTTTISHNLKEAGLTRKHLHKLATECDEVLHKDWKQSLCFHDDGSEFVCVDETSKNEHTYARRFGRAMSVEQAILSDVFVRGDRYSLVAAITVGGYIASAVVPGSLDSFDFYNFIAEDMVSCLFDCKQLGSSDVEKLPQMNPFPAERSVLVLDNCQIHHNEALVELVMSAGK